MPNRPAHLSLVPTAHAPGRTVVWWMYGGEITFRCLSCWRDWFHSKYDPSTGEAQVLPADGNRCSDCGGTAPWPRGVKAPLARGLTPPLPHAASSAAG